MSEVDAVEVPASLLKLEELRLESIQYWARLRALNLRREEITEKLSAAREYLKRLAEGKGQADLRRGSDLDRYENTQAEQARLVRALEALLAMITAEQERIGVYSSTADLFRRAEEHYRSAVVGWQRDAV